jgi:hypothetical protein
MASIVIAGDTSGTVTLAAPATAGTTTLTLPTTNGTVVVTGTTPTLNGITFPATQVPSANANTLDDYEEGTWSSTVENGANLSGTGTLDQALYTKVGRLVTVSGRITGVSVTSTNTTTYPVVTLPFAMTANSTAISGSVLMLVSSTWSAGAAVDNSGGETLTAALLLPAATVLTTGAASIWFSITYSSAA